MQSLMCHSIRFAFEPLGDQSEGLLLWVQFAHCRPQCSPPPKGSNGAFLISNTNVSRTRVLCLSCPEGSTEMPQTWSLIPPSVGWAGDTGDTPGSGRDPRSGATSRQALSAAGARAWRPLPAGKDGRRGCGAGRSRRGRGRGGGPPRREGKCKGREVGTGHALGRVLGGVGEVSGAANEGPRPRLRLPPGDNGRQREASQLRTRSALCLSETALRPAAACRTAPG